MSQGWRVFANVWLLVIQLVAGILLLAPGTASAQAGTAPCTWTDNCSKEEAVAACEARTERWGACATYTACKPSTGASGNASACINLDDPFWPTGWLDYKFYADIPFNPELNRGEPECCAEKAAVFGDPVDATTGNKFEVRTEFIAAGAFPLRAEWTYNANGTSAALGPEDLMFGRNRSHFYGR